MPAVAEEWLAWNICPGDGGTGPEHVQAASVGNRSMCEARGGSCWSQLLWFLSCWARVCCTHSHQELGD